MTNRRRPHAHLPVLLVAVVVASCRTAVREEVPALLVEPTPAADAELVAAIAAALGAAPVSVAPDALTRSSLLTLEHREPDGIPDRALTGRDLGRPERFRLVTDGKACILVHETGTARVTLLRSRCAPE